MNSTKITSCFVGNPLWPIMNLMNIKRVEGRRGDREGGEYISTTLCCLYLMICDPRQWDNGECFCTLNLPLCFSFISFTAKHWNSSVWGITADSMVHQTKGRFKDESPTISSKTRRQGLKDNNKEVKSRISRGSKTDLKHFLSCPTHHKQCCHFLKAFYLPWRIWHMS